MRKMVLQGAVCCLSLCQAGFYSLVGNNGRSIYSHILCNKRRVSLCPLPFNTLSRARALILHKLTDSCILGKRAACHCSRESNLLSPPILLWAYLHTRKYSFSQGPNPPSVRRPAFSVSFVRVSTCTISAA